MSRIIFVKKTDKTVSVDLMLASALQSLTSKLYILFIVEKEDQILCLDRNWVAFEISMHRRAEKIVLLYSVSIIIGFRGNS